MAGAAYGVLAVLGAALGVIGSFEFSWALAGLPVAALAWALLNLAALPRRRLGDAGKLGAAVPAVAWLLVVLVLSSQRPRATSW